MPKKRKKIVFILLGSYPYFSDDPKIVASGGAEIDAYSIATSLDQSQFDIHFIVGDFGQENMEIRQGITLHKFSSRTGIFNRLLNPLGLLFLIRNINPAILFSKGISWQTVELMIINRLVGSRLVIKSSHQRNIDGSLNTFFYGKLCRSYINTIDAFVLQNHQDEGMFQKTYPHFRNRLLTMRNFHEIPEKVVHTYQKQCVWIGRAEEFKRPELYLELASHLPEWQFHLIMPPSSNSLFEDTQKKSMHLTNVSFSPGLPRKEVYSLLAEAAFFVSTSSSEGFPNTFIDALKMSTPIVSFTDFDDLLHSSQSGKIVNNISEMAEVLEGTSEEEWQRLSHNAYQLAEREFSSRLGGKQYEALFESLR